ncbi:carbohydrate ABC transporter permease [Alicyclobacillus macrosporangiidus]|uniref:carbohydrate ABC transporter permease n=1 Tax=Alicyclobacillus macrosporangiidus TaxID=392015 RepID=UPI000496D210|nr:sugar ABC transporter permease [Alicyclobacillus macrosporangiidus]
MSFRLRRSVTAYLMLLPTLVLIGVFVVYPIVDSFVISFYKWDMLSASKPFVGLQNYIYIFEDPLFHTALKNTVLYVVFFVPIVLALGLLTAVLLNAKIRLLPLFRTAFFIPYVTSLAATGIVWQWIFNDQFGLLNYLLERAGLHAQDWLNDPRWTLFNIITIGVWQNLGYVAVIFLAGLQNISREYYEAADVDGATPWQKFARITLPLLSPTTYFLLILTTIEAFKVFLQIYVLYGETAGPNNSGMTLLYYMFTKGFGDYRMGYACASAYVLFLIVFVFTLAQMALSRRVHYEA